MRDSRGLVRGVVMRTGPRWCLGYCSDHGTGLWDTGVGGRGSGCRHIFGAFPLPTHAESIEVRALLLAQLGGLPVGVVEPGSELLGFLAARFDRCRRFFRLKTRGSQGSGGPGRQHSVPADRTGGTIEIDNVWT